VTSTPAQMGMRNFKLKFNIKVEVAVEVGVGVGVQGGSAVVTEALGDANSGQCDQLKERQLLLSNDARQLYDILSGA
jgi:hypothetical protein